jgi:DeoR family fructose operon transcriptional repressor
VSDAADDLASPALFQPERQREIAAYTLSEGRVGVAELAVRFNVTPETIRRDLSDLQRRRVLRRVHGGAVPFQEDAFEPLLSKRNDQHDGEKRRIARVAIDELPDGGTVIIDSGSTLTRFAEAIPRDVELRVVTNSLPTVQALSGYPDLDVVVIGGRLRKNTMAMVDTEAVETVQELNVDCLFISSDGASPDGGLTTPYRQEASLKRAMIRAARRVVALVDHSKFGHDHLSRFADWSEVDTLITTVELDPAIVAEIEARGTTVGLA